MLIAIYTIRIDVNIVVPDYLYTSAAIIFFVILCYFKYFSY